MPAFLKKRDNILVLAFGLVLVFFIGRMLQMQLIQGDEYESQIYKGTIKTQTVEAARGEITDRYGNPIVTNRVSMNIVLDKAFLPAETQNEIRFRIPSPIPLTAPIRRLRRSRSSPGSMTMPMPRRLCTGCWSASAWTMPR